MIFILARPIVGIIGNSYLIDNKYPAQGSGVMNIEAIAEVSCAIPSIIPSLPKCFSTEELLESYDGFLFTGGRPNVHPSHYGHEPTIAHGFFDQDRDELVLPLIKACEEKGKPILGVCRGFQEFNVAFGGTLHPEIRELPGRMNHRMPPDGTLEEQFAHRHEVEIIKGGIFEKILGSKNVLVNSLHGQGIDSTGDRVIIEGIASDGTPEALQIDGARGFCLAVQWHPEWKAASDKVSKPLFEAFGRALRLPFNSLW